METKFSYKAKLDILNAMSTKIAGLREDLVRLNNHELLAVDGYDLDAEEYMQVVRLQDDIIDAVESRPY